LSDGDDTVGDFFLDRFMVDAADHNNMELARDELFALLDKPTMAGIPVLVLGNKCDLPAAADEKQLTDKMCVISLQTVVINSLLFTAAHFIIQSVDLNLFGDQKTKQLLRCCKTHNKSFDNLFRTHTAWHYCFSYGTVR